MADTRSSGTAANAAPTIPPEALEAITAPRHPDAPRRCFICLTDEEPTDPAGSWVDPCPCTLEAHQDCMLSWVTDCERSNKPLQCPVCKSPVQLEGQWDPIVALSDGIQRRFTRASPFALFTATSMGVQLSLQMYGALALWTFSGRDAMSRYLLMAPDGLFIGPSYEVARKRLTHSIFLMNVAPALLFGQLLPGLSNKVYMPIASLYGMYHIMRDEHFLTWPPSPQLAMAVFPYIRSAYYNMWREFVLPYEVKLNRQLLGLPPVDPRQNERGAANNRRNGARNGAEGGVLGFLQTLLDALDPDEEENGERDGGGDRIRIQEEVQVQEGGEDGEVVMELVIEEVNEEGDDEDVPDLINVNGAPEAQQEAAPQAQEEPPADAPAQQHEQHEVPVAPPARQGIGSILSSVSNAIVGALILPGVSYVAGEVLRRVVLPRSWTTSPANPWLRYGPAGRPGLFQNQWGRSLVGGCVFVVLRDAVRVYAKHRKVAAMGNRRVKNVERRRSQK